MIWELTNELRWHRVKTGEAVVPVTNSADQWTSNYVYQTEVVDTYETVLQQKQINKSTGEKKWIAVPTVKEDMSGKA